MEEESINQEFTSRTAATINSCGGSAGGVGKKLGKQLSRRLQMRAPSSIEVAPMNGRGVTEWNVPIPLLSPLDISSLPSLVSSSNSSMPQAEQQQQQAQVSRWLPGRQHPAAPFYYEPPPTGNALAFALAGEG